VSASEHPLRGDGLTVVGLLASPNPHGATAGATWAVLRGCSARGADVQLVDLHRTPRPESAVARLEEADAVVFGSPVRRATYTSILGAFLEQVGRGIANDVSAPLRGKATAVVMTGQAREHLLATERLQQLLSSFFATQVLSPPLYLTGEAYDGAELTAAAAGRAALHGQALTDLARACRASAAIRQLTPVV
jgi:FMN reductase